MYGAIVGNGLLCWDQDDLANGLGLGYRYCAALVVFADSVGNRAVCDG